MSDTLTKERPAAVKPAAEDVIDFLAKNPDFLNRNPELYDILTPPKEKTQRGVVDFQHYMVKRLKEDRQDILQSAQEIVETTRANMSNQARIHAAVLMLLEAKNFEDFIRVMTVEFPSMLELDIVSLIIETDADTIPQIDIPGVRVAKPGMAELLLQGRNVTLESGVPGLPELYGAGANLVKSQALVRLNIAPGMPEALLAFGSRDAAMFQAGQATDLVTFLGRVIERCFRAWLDVPL